jgi:hypothetical protein
LLQSGSFHTRNCRRISGNMQTVPWHPLFLGISHKKGNLITINQRRWLDRR